MTTNPKDVADHEINELAGRFPALHQPSDCIAAVRRMVGVVGRILRPGDEQVGILDECVVIDGEPATYMLDDANRIAKHLRALAGIDESKPALTTSGLLLRLAPDIAALLQRGHTLAQVAGILAALGLDCTKVTPRDLARSSPSLRELAT